MTEYVTADSDGIKIDTDGSSPLILPRNTAEQVNRQLRAAIIKFDMIDYKNRGAHFFVITNDYNNMDAREVLVENVGDDSVNLRYTEDEVVNVKIEDLVLYSPPREDWHKS